MQVAFTVPGDPRGKGRPRATVRRTKGGAVHAGTYTDAATRAYEAKVKALAKTAMAGGAPLAGAVAVSLRIRIAVPTSFSKAKRARVLAGTEHYAGRFDVDNVAKAILDGMNGVCFVDDKQIDELFAFRKPHDRPGVDVRVRHVEEAEAA